MVNHHLKFGSDMSSVTMGNQANKQRNFGQIQPFRDVWGRQRRIFAAIVLKFSGNVDITLVNHHLKF